MNIIAPLHPAGWPFVAIFAAGTLFLSLLSSTLGFIGFVMTLWCIYFFRNPARVTPNRPGLVIAPADGRIVKVEQAVPPKELGLPKQKLTKVSIFLNVFDVHVNRIPVDGEITKHHYFPGKFFNASLDKASEDNERNSIVIKTDDNKEIVCVQIAGLIARRILSYVHEGDHVEAGQSYGIIRFGSRTDIYLPKGIEPLVCVGQRTVGGETIIADMKGKYSAMEGITNA